MNFSLLNTVGFVVALFALLYLFARANNARESVYGTAYRSAIYMLLDYGALLGIIALISVAFFGTADMVQNKTTVILGETISVWSMFGSLLFMLFIHLFVWKKNAMIEAHTSLNSTEKKHWFSIQINDKKSLAASLTITVLTIFLIDYYRLPWDFVMVGVDLLIVGLVVKHTKGLKITYKGVRAMRMALWLLRSNCSAFSI